MKNRYSKGLHISERKFREIVRYFAADLTALQTTELSGLNRKHHQPYLPNSARADLLGLRG